MSHETDIVDPAVAEAFSELGKLEADFAAVEIDAMRQKEYASKELYERRSKYLAKIPGFWSTVFTHGPQDLQAVLAPQDAEILDSITDFKVERYQIKSGSEGEPRSIRLTFEFDPEKNPYFEDKIVTKEFELVTREDGVSGLVSQPVNFTWTKEGKKQGFNKMIDLAQQLYQAEQALVGDRAKGAAKIEIEEAEREGLWQYEKLREQLEKEDEDEDVDQSSFLEFFAYRGAVGGKGPTKAEKQANGNVKQGEEEEDDVSDSEDEDDDDDAHLEVEIFPAGTEIAMALAEDLWPDAMQYFMQAQAEDDIMDDLDEMSEDDEDAPDLVTAEADFEGFEEGTEKRPAKKQRRS